MSEKKPEQIKDSEALVTQRTWNDPETVDLWKFHRFCRHPGVSAPGSP